ncbi:MAG: sugar kinase [Spirochaetia bacterium]|jgi:2-dehydro-3-deoxygluconokinase|nr:sugar kinase [Spirochaetia bacterium]
MKVVTFGEIMLRLKPEGAERFLQSPRFEATFGGGEANVAVALSRFGLDSVYVTAVPDNPIGEACIGELRRHGVDTSMILKTGKRLGIYYLEQGAAQRSSVVIYDREGSSVSEAAPDKYDWKKILSGAQWLHITGITPAISLNASIVALAAVKEARKYGLTVSCDLNYRGKLWKYGKKAPEVMAELMKYVDVAVGNEEDCQKSLGIDPGFTTESAGFDERRYKVITDAVLSAYPDLKKIAITLRQSRSADSNGWSAVINSRNEYLSSVSYSIDDIVDRVGSGDAFAAGLIHGLNKFKTDREALDFAVAASCLKHSIPGDLPLITEAEVLGLLKSGGSGRVQR